MENMTKLGGLYGRPQGFCHQITSQLEITCSKLTIEILEQGVKYVQNQQ